MRTAVGNVNQVTPAYKVGDVVEVTEENPLGAPYIIGDKVTIVSCRDEDFIVEKGPNSTHMILYSSHIKHPEEEGFPEQARIERGYWMEQLATDEIDTPMRSLNDVTPYEWDKASKSALPWTTSIGVIDEPDNFVMFEALFNERFKVVKTEEDEPDGFDIPDLNLQAANPLDTQIGGDHYRHMEIQPIEFITSNKLGWCEGHVVKYVSRHASKGGKQDLEKAKHYIDMLIEEVYYD